MQVLTVIAMPGGWFHIPEFSWAFHVDYMAGLYQNNTPPPVWLGY